MNSASAKFLISKVKTKALNSVYQAQTVASQETDFFQRRRYTIPAGTPGSGVGKGGGAGGSIKESGGGLGKYGAAQEEGYFYHKDREQMGKLKKKLKDEPDDEPPKEKPTQKPE